MWADRETDGEDTPCFCGAVCNHVPSCRRNDEGSRMSLGKGRPRGDVPCAAPIFTAAIPVPLSFRTSGRVCWRQRFVTAFFHALHTLYNCKALRNIRWSEQRTARLTDRKARLWILDSRQAVRYVQRAALRYRRTRPQIPLTRTVAVLGRATCGSGRQQGTDRTRRHGHFWLHCPLCLLP